MNLDDVSKAQASQLEELKSLAANADVVLEKAAVEVARMVRTQAAQRGHSVGIRVVRRSSGVRVTVTGPRAGQYRSMVEKALEARVPAATAEIRAQITRRAK